MKRLFYNESQSCLLMGTDVTICLSAYFWSKAFLEKLYLFTRITSTGMIGAFNILSHIRIPYLRKKIVKSQIFE